MDKPPQDWHLKINGREPPLVGRPVEITLLYLALTDHYEVQTIKNTNFYRPGDWLPADTVDKICHFKDWTITIQSYEFIKKMMDLLPKISII